jgi:hypothetical protein
MAGRGAEESRGAERRCQAFGRARVPCMALICQGIEAQKVIAHRQKLGSRPLASQKGLFTARD